MTSAPTSALPYQSAAASHAMTAVRAASAALCGYFVRHRTRIIIDSLDDHILRDIGLEPSDQTWRARNAQRPRPYIVSHW